jgi:hypothetical protein
MPNESNDETAVRPFCGLTRYSNEDMTVADLPDVGGHGSSAKWWTYGWAQRNDDARESTVELPEASFNSIINSLPRATTVTSGWKHPVTGEWVETSKHNALVDPETVEGMEEPLGTQADVAQHVDQLSMSEVGDLAARLGIEGDGPPTRDDLKDALVPGDDALYHIPTDSYSVINPAQSLRPLAEVLREEDYGETVFGEFRVFRGGGGVSGDIYIDGMHVETPETAGYGNDGVAADGGGKPTVVGLEVGYDYFGDTAFRVRGTALRTSCMNAMRAVTDWKVVKHSGDTEERVEWHALYEEILEELDLKRDQLSQVIAEASEMDFDLTELPEDFAVDHDSILDAFYDYSGFPKYLAEAAAETARAEAADPFAPTWWDLYNGATYAVTHVARGEAMGGGSIDNYARVADDLLMNPAAFEERVVNAYEVEREEREDASLADEGGGTAEIADAFASVRSRKETYKDRSEKMRQLAQPDAD